MSHHTIRHAQARSALKAGRSHHPHSQYHIYYHDEQDRHHVSVYTEGVLRMVMRKSNVHSIVIFSSVRNAQEQAEAMLNNLEKGKHVRYSRPGRSVQTIAARGLAAHKSHDEIIADMLKQIDKVGLTHVTSHAPASGLNTVDVSRNYLIHGTDQTRYDRYVCGLRDATLAGQIVRFGWPEGPISNGPLFNDDACLHVEIAQPIDFEPSSTVLV